MSARPGLCAPMPTTFSSPTEPSRRSTSSAASSSPGDVVAVEEPDYPPARDLFTSLGAQVVGVRVDVEGLVVDELPATARLVYTTPSHQFPLGMPMSLARRSALIAWATRHDAAVIEDDYDSEFRFSQRPLEPLVSLDQSGRVLSVGTFSKTLLPALRTGFTVTPASLRPALVEVLRHRLPGAQLELTSNAACGVYVLRKKGEVHALRIPRSCETPTLPPSASRRKWTGVESSRVVYGRDR